ncbi:uncharacterized protein LOC127640214 [Xyrauchen texanus]|uniref:uncharacterized protein LOC127640214 n=1 Tax=Xyrauchen texanus TaxID=154827 RepID=UPI002242018F|nr:uncharacterized protein LOC127640214 [Xyrauchen texanus]
MSSSEADRNLSKKFVPASRRHLQQPLHRTSQINFLSYDLGKVNQKQLECAQNKWRNSISQDLNVSGLKTKPVLFLLTISHPSVIILHNYFSIIGLYGRNIQSNNPVFIVRMEPRKRSLDTNVYEGHHQPDDLATPAKMMKASEKIETPELHLQRANSLPKDFLKGRCIEHESPPYNNCTDTEKPHNQSQKPEQIIIQIDDDNSTESDLLEDSPSLLKNTETAETPSLFPTAPETEIPSVDNQNNNQSNLNVQSSATDGSSTAGLNSPSEMSDNISIDSQNISEENPFPAKKRETPDQHSQTGNCCSEEDVPTFLKEGSPQTTKTKGRNLQTKPKTKQTNTAIQNEYCGLQNQGATCYLNAVLQCLFMTEDFRKAVLKKSWKPKSVSIELKHLFTCLRSKDRSVSTEGITNALAIGNVCEEQDAAEFLQKILSMIEPEPSEIFHGKKKHSSTCLQSQHESVEEINSFCFLAIAMDSDQHVINVQNSFNSQFEATLQEGEDQLFCENCKMMTDMKFSYTILQVPQVLVLQMQRFYLDYNSMTFLKNKRDVEIPLHLSVQDEGGVQYEYDLYAVINHSGSLSGGHYFADIKSFENQQWYQFNDSSVYRIQKFDGGRHLKKHFVSDMACLLFFKRSSAQPRAHTRKEMDIPSSTNVMTSSKSESPLNTLTKTHNCTNTEKPHNQSQKTEQTIIQIYDDNSTETAETPSLFPTAPENKMPSVDNQNNNQSNLNVQSSATDGSSTAGLNSLSEMSDNIYIDSQNMSEENPFPAKNRETPDQHSQTGNCCSEEDVPTFLKEGRLQTKKTKGRNLQTKPKTKQTKTAIQSDNNYKSTEKNLPQHLPNLQNTSANITETKEKSWQCLTDKSAPETEMHSVDSKKENQLKPNVQSRAANWKQVNYSDTKTVYINRCESELNSDPNTANDEGQRTQSSSLLETDESAQTNERSQNVSRRISIIYILIIPIVFILLLLVLLLTLV